LGEGDGNEFPASSFELPVLGKGDETREGDGSFIRNDLAVEWIKERNNETEKENENIKRIKEKKG
jgi:hypothetical protein